MPYQILCKGDIRYRMMDHPVFCGPACAQMIIESSPLNGPYIEQRFLFEDTLRYTTRSESVDWTTGPDGMRSTLRKYNPLTVNDYMIKANSSRDDINGWVAWSIKNHGLPVAMVTGAIEGYEHWVVIHGCLTNNDIQSATSDANEVLGFFIHNPTLRAKNVKVARGGVVSNSGPKDEFTNPDGQVGWFNYITMDAWKETFTPRRVPGELLDSRRYVAILVPFKDHIDPDRNGENKEVPAFAHPAAADVQPNGNSGAMNNLTQKQFEEQTKDLTEDQFQERIDKIRQTIDLGKTLEAVTAAGLESIAPWDKTIRDLKDLAKNPLGLDNPNLQPEVHAVEIRGTPPTVTKDFYFLILIRDLTNNMAIAVVARKRTNDDTLVLLESQAVASDKENVLRVPRREDALKLLEEELGKPGALSLDIRFRGRPILHHTPLDPGSIAEKLDVKVCPNLVWSPSFQSTSRFQPFYQFCLTEPSGDGSDPMVNDTEEHFRFIRIDAVTGTQPVVFRSLTNGLTARLRSASPVFLGSRLNRDLSQSGPQQYET